MPHHCHKKEKYCPPCACKYNAHVKVYPVPDYGKCSSESEIDNCKYEAYKCPPSKQNKRILIMTNGGTVATRTYGPTATTNMKDVFYEAIGAGGGGGQVSNLVYGNDSGPIPEYRKPFVTDDILKLFKDDEGNDVDIYELQVTPNVGSQDATTHSFLTYAKVATDALVDGLPLTVQKIYVNGKFVEYEPEQLTDHRLRKWPLDFSSQPSNKVESIKSRIYCTQVDTICGFDGTMLTQGSVTSAESAWFQHLMVPTSKPRALVYANEARMGVGKDAYLNLFNAVRVLSSKTAMDKGAFLMSNFSMISGREGVKDNLRLDAMQAGDLGHFGWVDLNGDPQFYRSPTRKHSSGSKYDIRDFTVTKYHDPRDLLPKQFKCDPVFPYLKFVDMPRLGFIYADYDQFSDTIESQVGSKKIFTNMVRVYGEKKAAELFVELQNTLVKDNTIIPALSEPFEPPEADPGVPVLDPSSCPPSASKPKGVWYYRGSGRSQFNDYEASMPLQREIDGLVGIGHAHYGSMAKGQRPLVDELSKIGFPVVVGTRVAGNVPVPSLNVDPDYKTPISPSLSTGWPEPQDTGNARGDNLYPYKIRVLMSLEMRRQQFLAGHFKELVPDFGYDIKTLQLAFNEH